MEIAAYVLSIDGKPLMPMHSFRRVKRYLKEEKAVVVSIKPYQIKLTYHIDNPIIKNEHLGIDTGRTNLGIAVIENDGSPTYLAHVATSNKDVPKHMSERAMHRRASRQGERKVRQRRAIKNGTVFEEGKSRDRILPKCEKPITNNYIINSEARFANRRREKGWLTPTARHLLHTIIKSIDMACSLLPVKDITIEITRWDFARMENPNIKNWEYQKGALFGFGSVEDAVYARQNGKCLLCKKSIEHYHHIIPKHLGGSNSIDNIAGLCSCCHQKIHTDNEAADKLKAKQEGLLKKFGALSVMNQIMPFLLTKVAEKYPDKDIYVTTGYETSQLRKAFDLPKTHVIDAWCIASTRIDKNAIKPSTITSVQSAPFEIKQFRHQNRAIINNQRERTYFFDGKAVAKNRHKRFEQKEDSLEEWYNQQIASYGAKEAEKMLSRLTVKASKRLYNNMDRVMPGAVFLYEGRRYVMSGQISNGQYYRAVGCQSINFPAKSSTIIALNTGLVYI